VKPFDLRLLRAVPATRRPVAALTAVGVLSGAATVATAFALTGLVVAVVEGTPVLVPAVWLAGLFGLRALLGGTGDLVAAWAGGVISTRLRGALLRTWGRLPAERRPDRDTAVTLATVGATTVEPYAARYLPTLLTAGVVPGMALVALAVVDWPSAVIVLLTVPLLPVFAALIGKATQASTERRWAALATLSGHFLDVVRGLPTLVSYGRARRQVDQVREVSERHRRATMETLKIAFLSSAALELLASISVAIVAVVVGLRLSFGTMPLSAGLVAILLAPEAYWPIRRVGAEFHAAADGAAALDEILTHLATPTPSPYASNGVFEGELGGTPTSSVTNTQFGEVRGLEYRYAAELAPVLTGLDLRLGHGLTLVTGPSGAGKSTLLELLAGLREPTGGTLIAPPAHLVTQRPFLPAGTVRDALTIGLQPESSPVDGDDGALWEALRRVGLDGVVAGLPDGLDARLGDDGFGLSAGQRQRLALARASLAPEPLLLLDEPTAHLDGEAARAVRQLVAELARDRIVVAVSHEPDLLAGPGTARVELAARPLLEAVSA
jgi:ATP-binding cassette subfamily C protein CydD/ATP-binding cassette subfamily C protein CydCD